jgi:hypothetical protein
MTISVDQGKSGWGNYVLYGTKEKPRDTEKVFLVNGDVALTERLANQNDTENKYYRIVISLDDKYSNETAIERIDEAFKLFMHGYKEDEYNYSIVLHQDTEHTHAHIMIPKQNMLTGQELQLYYDKVDRQRKELIQDFISLKYGMKIARESNQQLIASDKELAFENWRETYNKPKFEFSLRDSKAKKLVEQEIYSIVEKCNNDGILNSLDDVKTLIQDTTGLTVIKADFDRKKSFHYFTIQDNDGKKTRVRGELFSEDFWKESQEERQQQLSNNERKFSTDELRLKDVQKALTKEQRKRREKLYDLFSKNREKAELENQHILNNKEFNNEKFTSTAITKSELEIDRAEPRIERDESIDEFKASAYEVSFRSFKRESEDLVSRARKTSENLPRLLQSSATAVLEKDTAVISRLNRQHQLIRLRKQRIAELKEQYAIRIRERREQKSTIIGKIRELIKTNIIDRIKQSELIRRARKEIMRIGELKQYHEPFRDEITKYQDQLVAAMKNRTVSSELFSSIDILEDTLKKHTIELIDEKLLERPKVHFKKQDVSEKLDEYNSKENKEEYFKSLDEAHTMLKSLQDESTESKRNKEAMERETKTIKEMERKIQARKERSSDYSMSR